LKAGKVILKGDIGKGVKRNGRKKVKEDKCFHNRQTSEKREENS